MHVETPHPNLSSFDKATPVWFQAHQLISRTYVELLTQTGVSVSIAQLRWYTTCLNRLFVRIGSWKPNFLKTWFTLGVCFGLIAMVMAVFLLTLMVVNTLWQKPVEQQILTPVVSEKLV